MQEMMSDLPQCSTAWQSGQDAIIGGMKTASFAVFFLFLAACRPLPAPAPALSPTPLPAVTLRPYASATSAPTSAPTRQEATSLPAPTSTPFLHTVASGDTLLGIAARYGLTLEDVLSANPGIDPNFLSVGMTLTIPLTPADENETPPQAVLFPLELSPPACFPLPDETRWCVVEVTNPGEVPVSAVSLAWRLAPGVEMLTTALPFDVLPPHTTLPVAATLPAARDAAFPQVALRSVLPWSGTEASWPRLSTPESIAPPLPAGQVHLSGSLPPAGDADTTSEGVVLAVGYDAQGRIAALRQSLVPLEGASSAAWELTLTSLRNPLSEVLVWVAYRAAAP